MSFDLSRGSLPWTLGIPLASGGEFRIAAPICFEATNSDLCRLLVYGGWASGRERRAGLMVNLTNDGWFAWWDPGRELHLLACRWRCLELATPMVRAANTGISAAIDARGRVIKAGIEGGGRARVEGVFVADVAAGVARSPFALRGNTLPWAALAAAGVLLAGTFFRSKPN
jgi:apolipoprotein N-acyltransferase